MVHTQGGSVLYVCTEFEADSSFLSKVIRGSQNFEIGSRDPGHAHVFIFRTQAWSVLHLCTEFEGDCSIRSKVIKGVQKLGN